MSRLTTAVYLRAGEELEADDLRDLEDYFAHLRSFYDIPKDQPVFPPRPRSRREEPKHERKPRATGRNGADHPWRNTL